MKTLPIALALLSACGPPADASGPSTTPATLTEDYVQRALTLSDDEVGALDAQLQLRLREDPHAYFRYVSRRAVALQCELANEGPTVNLHGDLHLQQYLVTSLGRGLGDFDEATQGPAAIDIVRLAASVHIVARMFGWDGPELFDRFITGYLASLNDPEYEAPEPALAAQIREGFTHDHNAFLTHCDALFEPIDRARAEVIQSALTSYVERLQAHRPELDPAEFQVVSVGPHHLGIASRQVNNYIIRVRGPTDSPDDDRILEAKEVTTNPDAWCLPSTRAADPLRVLLGDARLSYSPYQLIGFIEVEGHPYWVHEWLDDYVELRVDDPATTEAMVAEVLYDMGVQLGRGHPRGLASPYEAELRRSLVIWIERRRGALWDMGGTFAGGIWAAWESGR